MKNSWTIKALTVLLSIGAFATPVFAADDDYEELRYEDLVNQLSRKRDTPTMKSSPDDVMIHAGFGFVSTANQIRFPGEVRSRPLNGFQLSAGIDLLSTQWMGEFIFRNFANHHSGGEVRSLRENDWKVVYRQAKSDRLELRYGIGFGSRTFRLNDPTTGYGFENETPVGLLTVGLETAISKTVSLGVETGGRAALVTNTNDINAIDLTMRLESRF